MYLAEGATHSGFQLFYLLQNPNPTAATVDVRYLLPSGAPLVETWTIPARERLTIYVNTRPGLASTDVAAAFISTNGVPVVVERAMYRDSPGRIFSAGHAVCGATAPAMQWTFAEGATGSFFDEFLLLANPSSMPALVEATYQLRTGATVTRTYTVPPQGRYTVYVDADPALTQAEVAVALSGINGVPFVAERAMYWPDGDWYEGTPRSERPRPAWPGHRRGARGRTRCRIDLRPHRQRQRVCWRGEGDAGVR